MASSDKTAESFDRVFDTKVDSAFVLSRKLQTEPQVLVSSRRSRAIRQSRARDYAAANEVLIKYRFVWIVRGRAGWSPSIGDPGLDSIVSPKFESSSPSREWS